MIPGLMECVILGNDWLTRSRTIINYLSRTIEINGASVPSELTSFDYNIGERIVPMNATRCTCLQIMNFGISRDDNRGDVTERDSAGSVIVECIDQAGSRTEQKVEFHKGFCDNGDNLVSQSERNNENDCIDVLDNNPVLCAIDDDVLNDVANLYVLIMM